MNINDSVAKLLANSLAKGEMPNLKKLHLEGNKITDEGQDALINALKNETVQDVIITAITLYEKYQLNVSGNKEKQRSILENQLERARAHGVDVDNVVVDKTLSGWLEHKYQLYKGLSVGWTKCFISYDDIQHFFLAVRRLHDFNTSGWCVLICLAPLGLLLIIYLMFKKGTDGVNDYGEPPTY